MNAQSIKPIGTIFATESQLAKADRFFDKQAKQRDKIARTILSGCRRVMEQGEFRYYSNETTFAVMSRANKVLWFEIRKDGVYSIPSAK